MKKLFSFLAIIAIIFASNCSRIPENNDPVIGIWSRVEVETTSTTKLTVRREWIFNDAYLGRFHRIENGSVKIKSDFKWSLNSDDTYTISYPGLDRADDIVNFKNSDEKFLLERVDGFMLASRE